MQSGVPLVEVPSHLTGPAGPERVVLGGGIRWVLLKFTIFYKKIQRPLNATRGVFCSVTISVSVARRGIYQSQNEVIAPPPPRSPKELKEL